MYQSYSTFMKGGGGSKKNYTNPVTKQKTDAINSSNDCANLRMDVFLSDPQRNALLEVDEGDLLFVRFSASTNRVNVLNRKEEICGFVIHPNLSDLINCIRKGVIFEAVVEFVSEASCHVIIQPDRR